MVEFHAHNSGYAGSGGLPSAEVGDGRIAGVFARALLDAAKKAGVVKIVVEELDAVIAEVFAPMPTLTAVLASPFIAGEAKSLLLDHALSGRVQPLLLNFLKVLARRGRWNLLAAINVQLQEMFEHLQGKLRVELRTAAPLSPPVAERVTALFRARLKAEPIVQHKIDPALLGGAVIRIGDVVYDGSLAGQLQALRQHVVQRFAHEVQRRRNRFRDSAGN